MTEAEPPMQHFLSKQKFGGGEREEIKEEGMSAIRRQGRKPLVEATLV